MKTFLDYVKIKEMASYGVQDGESKNPDAENKLSMKDVDEATKLVMRALTQMMKTRPEVIVAFLNQHRMDPDIRQILNDKRLDSFSDISKPNGHADDKALGDRTGKEEGEEIAPNAADGYKTH